MHEISYHEFWWNDIAGARNLINMVVNSIYDKKFVALHIPSDLPWRESMRACIQNKIKKNSNISYNVVIEIIDIADEYRNNQSPGMFLLQRFSKKSIANGYRESERLSIQKYMLRNNVLNNRIIWLKGMEEDSINAWIQFCNGFEENSNVYFILEIKNDSSFKESPLFNDVYFSKTVFPYDVYLFNRIVLADKNSFSEEWMKYIAVITTKLCEVDAEVAYYFINNTDFRNEDCLLSLKKISKLPKFTRRGSDYNQQHILAICRQNLDDLLQKKLWEAQVNVLFSIIEIERMKIIDDNISKLSTLLNNFYIEQYGEKLCNSYDLELGTLKYIYENKKYKNFSCDEFDYRKIVFLRQCRNKLAHMNCCCYDEVRILLDKEYH